MKYLIIICLVFLSCNDRVKFSECDTQFEVKTAVQEERLKWIQWVSGNLDKAIQSAKARNGKVSFEELREDYISFAGLWYIPEFAKTRTP